MSSKTMKLESKFGYKTRHQSAKCSPSSPQLRTKINSLNSNRPASVKTTKRIPIVENNFKTPTILLTKEASFSDDGEQSTDVDDVNSGILLSQCDVKSPSPTNSNEAIHGLLPSILSRRNSPMTTNCDIFFSSLLTNGCQAPKSSKHVRFSEPDILNPIDRADIVTSQHPATPTLLHQNSSAQMRYRFHDKVAWGPRKSLANVGFSDAFQAVLDDIEDS